MTKITISIAGDFIPVESINYDEYIIRLFNSCDFSIANLETPLTESKTPIYKTGKCFKGDEVFLIKKKG